MTRLTAILVPSLKTRTKQPPGKVMLAILFQSEKGPFPPDHSTLRFFPLFFLFLFFFAPLTRRGYGRFGRVRRKRRGGKGTSNKKRERETPSFPLLPLGLEEEEGTDIDKAISDDCIRPTSGKKGAIEAKCDALNVRMNISSWSMPAGRSAEEEEEDVNHCQRIDISRVPPSLSSLSFCTWSEYHHHRSLGSRSFSLFFLSF